MSQPNPNKPRPTGHATTAPAFAATFHPPLSGPVPTRTHLVWGSLLYWLLRFFNPTRVYLAIKSLNNWITPRWIPSTVFLLKENYKIDAAVSCSSHNMGVRRLVVDTGAGTNVVNPHALPAEYRNYLRPIPKSVHVFDASGQALRFDGMINLFITVARYRVKANFFVCPSRTTDILHSAEFLDRHVRGICPQDGHMEMPNSGIVPLIRRSTEPTNPRSERTTHHVGQNQM